MKNERFTEEMIDEVAQEIEAGRVVYVNLDTGEFQGYRELGGIAS